MKKTFYFFLGAIIAFSSFTFGAKELDKHVYNLFKDVKIKFNDLRINKDCHKHISKNDFWKEYISLSKDYDINLTLFDKISCSKLDYIVSACNGCNIVNPRIYKQFCIVDYPAFADWQLLLVNPVEDCLQLQVTNKSNVTLEYPRSRNVFEIQNNGFDSLVLMCAEKRQKLQVKTEGIKAIDVKESSTVELNLIEIVQMADPHYDFKDSFGRELVEKFKSSIKKDELNRQIIRIKYVFLVDGQPCLWNISNCKILLKDGRVIMPSGSGYRNGKDEFYRYVDFPCIDFEEISCYEFYYPSELKTYTIKRSDFKDYMCR